MSRVRVFDVAVEGSSEGLDLGAGEGFGHEAGAVEGAVLRGVSIITVLLGQEVNLPDHKGVFDQALDHSRTCSTSGSILPCSP